MKLLVARFVSVLASEVVKRAWAIVVAGWLDDVLVVEVSVVEEGIFIVVVSSVVDGATQEVLHFLGQVNSSVWFEQAINMHSVASCTVDEQSKYWQSGPENPGEQTYVIIT